MSLGSVIMLWFFSKLGNFNRVIMRRRQGNKAFAVLDFLSLLSPLVCSVLHRQTFEVAVIIELVDCWISLLIDAHDTQQADQPHDTTQTTDPSSYTGTTARPDKVGCGLCIVNDDVVLAQELVPNPSDVSYHRDRGQQVQPKVQAQEVFVYRDRW